MATALLGGVVKAGIVAPKEIGVTDRHTPATEAAVAQYGVTAFPDNRSLVQAAEAILLCVKPNDALDALREAGEGGLFRDKLLISIVTGVSVEKLEAAAGPGVRVIRVMPNTPALVGKGAAALARGAAATDADVALTRQIFEAVGKIVEVKESLLDAVTGLSGSGPAYIYLVIEALADGGVRVGLSRDLALQLAAQTVAGAAAMVLETGLHPAVLKDQVTSPGGTTIAALESLERNGARHAMIEAVRVAAERSKELGS